MGLLTLDVELVPGIKLKSEVRGEVIVAREEALL